VCLTEVSHGAWPDPVRLRRVVLEIHVHLGDAVIEAPEDEHASHGPCLGRPRV